MVRLGKKPTPPVYAHRVAALRTGRCTQQEVADFIGVSRFAIWRTEGMWLDFDPETKSFSVREEPNEDFALRLRNVQRRYYKNKKKKNRYGNEQR